MKRTDNLGLALYDSSDKFRITGESQSFNHNMKLLDEAIANKVGKEEGKGLSTYDYDQTAKDKVDAIPEDPKYTDTVYDDTEIRGMTLNYDMKVALDNLFKCVAYDGDSDYASAYENFKIAFGIAELLSISAVFNGSVASVGTDAKDLDITVIGHYSGEKTAVLTGWTISGTVVVGTNVFTIAFGEFTTTVSVTGVEELIPSEYTRCSYIKSSGAQYILIPTKKMIAGTDKFIADFKINEDAKNNTAIFGGYTGSGVGRLGLIWLDGYMNYSGNNNWAISVPGFELSTNNRVLATLDTKNGIAQLGGNRSEFTTKSYTSNFLCIFGYASDLNYAEHKTSMTLYRFNQYRNDKLFTDLVPCLRNSDNVAGLYDLVDGIFYENAGTGTFEYEVA